MQKRLQSMSMTVSQSMVVVFLSGVSVALLFAAHSLFQHAVYYRAAAQDRALLIRVQNAADIIEDIQQERLLSVAVVVGHAEAVPVLLDQRARTDAALEQLVIQAGQLPDSFGPFDTLTTNDSIQQILSRFRASMDTLPASGFEEMATLNAQVVDMVTGIARTAAAAKSIRVAISIRDAVALLEARESLSLEAALGLVASTGTLGGSPSNITDLARYRAQTLVSDTALVRLSLITDHRTRVAIETWRRGPNAAILARLRRDVLNAPDASSLEIDTPGWLAAYTSTIDAHAEIEQIAIAQAYRTARNAMSALWNDALRDLGILIALFLVFGSLGYLILTRINRSIRMITGSIGQLSKDASTAIIPACPQPDLNQISEALRTLKATQLAEARSREADEQIRRRIDAKLDAVLTSAEAGAGNHRIEILGLDAHGAVLARGINRLLDQLEHDPKGRKPQTRVKM